jgi:hypothetical protein
VQKNLPNGVKPTMGQRKLRSGVNWQGTLKQKDVKQTCVKHGLGIFPLIRLLSNKQARMVVHQEKPGRGLSVI